ncbi:hypothetical protein CROQUDRAFT_94499 [Cronartium quercuum f. sp. fusiforme G11]|uniref:Uncharacterized protein n=1 Tax=Cronartium quercuum f. sp. fusiforme G11 TaxID=708437 RepID=A0A9P6NJZ2_9BASI|nr:hypothetical protein CROQUDRAFT_94499 [Cronartium quercuum f. sp. fusiforme G11]
MSPQLIAVSHPFPTSDWKLNDFFNDYERLLIALDGDELSELVNDRLLDNQLTTRQRYKFSATRSPSSAAVVVDFIRFLEATRSNALIEAVVRYFARSLHGQNLLRKDTSSDNAFVKKMISEMSDTDFQATDNIVSDPTILTQDQSHRLESVGGQMYNHVKPKLSLRAERSRANHGHSHWNLNDYISDRDKLLCILDEGLLDAIIHHRSFDDLLSDRQRLEFSRHAQDTGTRFLRFLSAIQSIKLLDAFIVRLALDPIGREVLNMENSHVQEILEEIFEDKLKVIEEPSKPTPDSEPLTSVVKSTKQPLEPYNPFTDFITSVPKRSRKLAEVGRLNESEENYKRYKKNIKAAIMRSYIPEPILPNPKLKEIPILSKVVKDIELSGTRVILTRTHTIYWDSTSRCFLGFNIVFQPLDQRITKAQITIQIRPLASREQPIIVDIVPNSRKQWSTGPTVDVTSNTKKIVNLSVGQADYIVSTTGLEKSREIKSASSASLTAAGVATPKLTIGLKENQAGDGILYSFSFGVTLDLLSNHKPTFDAHLTVSWQFARVWFSRTRPILRQTLTFDPDSQLDGPSPVTRSSEFAY